jgi:hypothetical protein
VLFSPYARIKRFIASENVEEGEKEESNSYDNWKILSK